MAVGFIPLSFNNNNNNFILGNLDVGKFPTPFILFYHSLYTDGIHYGDQCYTDIGKHRFP